MVSERESNPDSLSSAKFSVQIIFLEILSKIMVIEFCEFSDLHVYFSRTLYPQFAIDCSWILHNLFLIAAIWCAIVVQQTFLNFITLLNSFLEIFGFPMMTSFGSWMVNFIVNFYSGSLILVFSWFSCFICLVVPGWIRQSLILGFLVSWWILVAEFS